MEPSHVLQALGVLSDDTQAALRLTIGRSTTLADVEKAIADVVDVVAKLRG